MNVAWRKVVMAGCVLVGLAGTSAAADKPAAKPASGRAGVDAKLYEALKDIHNRGADMYNNQDHAGCYRLFEGALRVAAPMLSDRPDVQQMIESGLNAAEREPSLGRRAFRLHELIERVREKIKPGASASTPQTTKPKNEPPRPRPEQPPRTKPEQKPPRVEAEGTKTLWERMGGLEKVSRIVDDFFALAAGDAAVDLGRGRKYLTTAEAQKNFKSAMVDFISQNTGGPRRYTGKSMKAVHKGMGITNDEFEAAAKDLRTVLRRHGVKQEDIDELMRIAGTTRKDIVEAGKKDKGKE
jgi:hemoglobin